MPKGGQSKEQFFLLLWQFQPLTFRVGAKSEIGWNTPGEDGVKRHVYAQKHGRDWLFFERPRRKGRTIQWIPMEKPPLSDWLELLDCVERRAARDLHPPETAEYVKKLIRDRFPNHSFS